MKTKTNLLFLAFIFTLIACKKENDCDLTLPEVIVDDPVYFPLTIGNYWIYDVYKVDDTTGIEEQLTDNDTLKIISETLINGKHYFELVTNNWLSQGKDTLYYRDSSGYIVNLAGDIIFSHQDFNTILHQVDHPQVSLAITYSVSETPENITVPSGTFECFNYKGRVYYTNPNDNRPDRFFHNCYAQDVGLVFETTFFSSSFNIHYERRLSEYHIE